MIDEIRLLHGCIAVCGMASERASLAFLFLAIWLQMDGYGLGRLDQIQRVGWMDGIFMTWVVGWMALILRGGRKRCND